MRVILYLFIQLKENTTFVLLINVFFHYKIIKKQGTNLLLSEIANIIPLHHQLVFC